MAKPIKTLELHYPMIQFLIINNRHKPTAIDYLPRFFWCLTAQAIAKCFIKCCSLCVENFKHGDHIKYAMLERFLF